LVVRKRTEAPLDFLLVEKGHREEAHTTVGAALETGESTRRAALARSNQ
jgi:hypothetical protein